MAMIFWKTASMTVVGACLAIIAIVTVPSNAEAREYESISPAFAPDTSWSLNVGDCAAGDIIWWYWESSDILDFWLVKYPGGVQLTGFTDWDGYFVEESGSYSLVWFNNNLFFSAEVFYSVEVFTPSAAVVTKPSDSVFVNASTVDIQGTYDYTRAEGVLVGVDPLHLRDAMTVGPDWGVDDLVLSEGANTVVVRTYYWLDIYGYGNVTIDRTLNVFVDTTAPTVSVTGPDVGADVRGGYVDVTWQCADNTGIISREMKIDGWGWQPVSGYEVNHVWLPSGYHVIQIKVTDNAGNQAIGSTSFNNDNRALSFGGPYYGLPIIAIILVVVIVGAVLFVKLRKRKGSPSVASVPMEEPVPGAP